MSSLTPNPQRAFSLEKATLSTFNLLGLLFARAQADDDLIDRSAEEYLAMANSRRTHIIQSLIFLAFGLLMFGLWFHSGLKLASLLHIGDLDIVGFDCYVLWISLKHPKLNEDCLDLARKWRTVRKKLKRSGFVKVLAVKVVEHPNFDSLLRHPATVVIDDNIVARELGGMLKRAAEEMIDGRKGSLFDDLYDVMNELGFPLEPKSYFYVFKPGDSPQGIPA